MVVIGIILLMIGLLVGAPALWVIGLVLAAIGLIVNLAYVRPRGGGYWY